jgi:nucleoside-diphosphate-sugar epimerase
VIHAASLVGPAGILRYAGRLGPEMIEAAHMVLDACRRAGKPVVLFSSAEVYGRSGDLAESDDIVVPIPYSVRIEYALAKTLIEAMAVNSRAAGVPSIVIRPFNVAGPRQSRANGFVMPTFVQQALAGRPITVFDTGEQTRAFLSVTDLARFIVDHLEDAFASGHSVFNLGNPANKTSILGLAERIKRMTQSPSPIERVDAKTVHGELYEEAASRDKIPVLKNALEVGWRPEIGLDTLIDETIAHYQAYGDERYDVSH